MQLIVGAVAIPLLILNLVGGFAAVVWLAILGEWQGLIIWLVVMVAGARTCTLLILPGLLVTFPGLFLLGKGGILKMLGFVMCMMDSFWTFFVMSIWAMVSFAGLGVANANSDAWFPYLLLAYSVATGPWAYMASKDDNDGDDVIVFFLQIACAATIVMVGFTTMTDQAILLSLVGIVFVGYLLNVFTGGVALIIERKQQRATTDYAEV